MRRLFFLLRYYVVTVLIFAVAKVVFMLVCREGHDFTAHDVAEVLWHGLSLDLSTALYFLIVPFLVTMVSVWWPHVPRTILRCYYLLVAVAFSLAFVADTSLYPFWLFKLDASCLGYLETPGEAFASVTTGYLVVRLILTIIVAAVLFLIQIWTEKRSMFNVQRSMFLRPCGSKRPKAERNVQIISTVTLLLLTPVIVIGIRGGLGESTTNIGQVYYSDNQFLNHSAVNPVFSFLSSLGKSGSYIVVYDFFSDEECQQLTNGFWTTPYPQRSTLNVQCSTFTVQRSMFNVQRSTLTTSRPNIIIVVMESCGGQFTELGGNNEITPRLNKLATEGIYFTNCFANSWRTDKGVVSVLGGYPAFPVTSIMKVPEKSRKLPSIARKLAGEGYDCSFVYGGDINFTNMRSYVMSSGYSHLRWKADYSREEQQTSQWGVRDDIVLKSVTEDVAAEPVDGRWMKTVLTLSSHEPWDVPTRKLSDPVYNAFNYLDQSVGDFIDELRQTPQWRNLLVIILPDHGYRYHGIDERTLLYNHIPMIWVGGAVKEPCRVDNLCNQSDLAATLLAQMGLSHDEFTFSRDVLSPDYIRPFAFHTWTGGLTMIDSTGFVAWDLDAEAVIAKTTPYPDRLLRQGKAVLQTASKDFANK